MESEPQAEVPFDQLVNTSPPADESSADDKKRRPGRPTSQEKWERERADETLRGMRIQNDKGQAEVDAQKARIARETADHKKMWELRIRLSLAGLLIVVAWQFWIFCMVGSLGEGKLRLSDSIVLALVTTTTVNVFGLLVIVLKFVFPPPQGKAGDGEPPR